MLSFLDGVPDELYDVSPAAVHEVLGGPTLITVEGEREPPLFVSVLLHGNEPAGLFAMQRVLRAFRGRPLPRSLLLFVGNVSAAREGLRRLDGQPDYNRVWLGGDTPEHAMAARVLDEVRARGAFASVDVHNNSGKNPHYACVNTPDPGSLHLAARFAERAIYSTTPRGVLTSAMSPLCPSVTLECGHPDDEAGYALAARFIEELLALERIDVEERLPAGLRLYESAAVLCVPDAISFAFEGGADADLVFPRDLDELNFRELSPGVPLARARPGVSRPILALCPDGADLTERFFTVDDGRVLTREALVPSMLTLDARVIRQDCLGYLLVPRDIM